MTPDAPVNDVKNANQGGNDRRTAAGLANQRLKYAHQAPGRSALGKKVARQCEDRNAGQHVIRGQAVIFWGPRIGSSCPRIKSAPPRQSGEHRRPKQVASAGGDERRAINGR